MLGGFRRCQGRVATPASPVGVDRCLRALPAFHRQAFPSTPPQPESHSMKYAIPLLFLSLAGCGAGVVPPPAVEIRTVTKTVEVQKPCPVTVPVRPAPLAKPLPTDLGKLVAVLGAKLVEYAGSGAYADRADAALRKCTTP
jgi:hypothetical protein